MLSKQVFFLGLLLFIWSCNSNNKDQPEHLRQQQRWQERIQAKRKSLQQPSNKSLVGKIKKKTLLWPTAVRQAYIRLLEAGSITTPHAVQTLSQLGMPAAEALRQVIADSKLSSEKRGLASMFLVELHVFRPQALAKMILDSNQPILQKGAIEALARYRTPFAEKHLDHLRQQIMHHRSSTPPTDANPNVAQMAPLTAQQMVSYINSQLRRPGRWIFTEQQLSLLDRLLNTNPAAVQDEISDQTLKPGLLYLLHSPVTQLSTKVFIAEKLVQLVARNRQQLRKFCQPEAPLVLRLAAAKNLLGQGHNQDRLYLKKLSGNAQDPLSPTLDRLLSRPHAPQSATQPDR